MLIKSDGFIEKATKLADGEVEFVVSTGAWDAHGERIDVDGISFKDYKKNPVVLWGHDGFNLPIARTEKIWKEGGKLMARAKFYLKDQFANKVYNYIVDGFLNAVSIGGMVEEWGNDGLTISKLNMKEFSVVTIPANPEAIVASKSLTDTEKTELDQLAKDYAYNMIAKSQKNSIAKEIERLESLTATLKEVATETDKASAVEPQTTRVALKAAQAVDAQVEKIIVKMKGRNNE